MGRFRCLSKPTKRFLFAYADKVSDKWIKIVLRKYTLKYIKKKNKLSNNYSIDSQTLHPSQYYIIPGLNEYIKNMKIALNDEKSSCHSKVREYWLRRGPRLLLILLLTVSITIGFAELVTDATYHDHLYSVIIGFNMIVYSIYMLYQRLIDSISGCMMKIGHSHYNKWKSNLNITNESIDSDADTDIDTEQDDLGDIDDNTSEHNQNIVYLKVTQI